MFFAEQRDFENALKKQPWFVDYHYQNQTDWPDGMKAKEWSQRQRDWEEAIGDDAPSNRGFTMNLHQPYWHTALCKPSSVLKLVKKAWPEATLADIVGGQKAAENVLKAEKRDLGGLFI